MLELRCEVLGDGLDEVGRGHEDGEGADDGEEGEGHQAEAVHHGRRKLPLAAHRLTLVLLTETVGDVRHLPHRNTQTHTHTHTHTHSG